MENYIYKTNELYHHGIKGMKWGIRRYQNKDGSLTDAGKKRLVSRVQRATVYISMYTTNIEDSLECNKWMTERVLRVLAAI